MSNNKNFSKDFTWESIKSDLSKLGSEIGGLPNEIKELIVKLDEYFKEFQKSNREDKTKVPEEFENGLTSLKGHLLKLPSYHISNL